MMQRRLLAVGLVATLGLVAVACGDDDDSSSATTTGPGECKPGKVVTTPIAKITAAGAGKSVGVLYDVTGRGDKSFNDGAAAGLDQAKTDFGITAKESTPVADGDRADRMKSFVGNTDLVEAVGFLWNNNTNLSATQNPNQKYVQIDGVVFTTDSAGKATTTPAPNALSILFTEEQSSFLVGAAAACTSKSGQIGFIGGVENDLIKKFEAGYKAGATAVNPDVEVDVKYITQPPDFTGFNDPTKGKAIAAQMITDGDDVIYAAAGGSGKGMFTAAVESGKQPGDLYVIGVDGDQYASGSDAEKPFILTSALKRVDVATYEAIGNWLNNDFKGGQTLTYSLKNNGVGYSGSNPDIEKYAGTIEDLKQQIIDGKITVPTKPS